MKPVWLSLTCLTALLTGVFIGRHSAAPVPGTPPAGSAARPGGPGAPARAEPGSGILTRLQQISGIRRKTTLMLNHLAKGQSGNMRQLVEVAGNDYNQLLLLADIALHTDPAGFLKGITKNPGTQNFQDLIVHDFAKRWAIADFNAAFETSLTLPHPVNHWLGGVVLETRLATDPTAALKLAVAHPDLRFPWDNDLKIPATPENVELVRALPPSMGQVAIIKAIASNLPVDQAFDLVFESRHSNPLHGAVRVSHALVEKSPPAAQEWVLANPEHPARSLMARRVGDHLIRTNPAAAVGWAASHLSGSSRTSTLEKAASALQKTDPEAAAAARALLPQAFKTGGKP